MAVLIFIIFYFLFVSKRKYVLKITYVVLNHKITLAGKLNKTCLYLNKFLNGFAVLIKKGISHLFKGGTKHLRQSEYTKYTGGSKKGKYRGRICGLPLQKGNI